MKRNKAFIVIVLFVLLGLISSSCAENVNNEIVVYVISEISQENVTSKVMFEIIENLNMWLKDMTTLSDVGYRFFEATTNHNQLESFLLVVPIPDDNGKVYDNSSFDWLKTDIPKDHDLASVVIVLEGEFSTVIDDHVETKHIIIAKTCVIEKAGYVITINGNKVIDYKNIGIINENLPEEDLPLDFD